VTDARRFFAAAGDPSKTTAVFRKEHALPRIPLS
jgi:hypothetical protein